MKSWPRRIINRMI